MDINLIHKKPFFDRNQNFGLKKFLTLGVLKYFFLRNSCLRFSSWKRSFSSECAEIWEVWTPLFNNWLRGLSFLEAADMTSESSVQLPRSWIFTLSVETVSLENKYINLGRFELEPCWSFWSLYNFFRLSSHLRRNFFTAWSWTLALTFKSGSRGLVMSKK